MDLQGISDLKHVDKFVGMKLKDASRPSILAVFRRFVDSDDGQTSEWPNAEKMDPTTWRMLPNLAEFLAKILPNDCKSSLKLFQKKKHYG